MRVAGFVLYCFASMLAPVGIGLGLVAFRSPLYRVVGEFASVESGSRDVQRTLFGDEVVEYVDDVIEGYPSAVAGAGATFADSTVAFIFEYPDAPSARNAAASLVDRIPISFQSSGPGGIRYTRSESGAKGLVRVIGRHNVWIEGPTRELVDLRFSALPAIEPNPDLNFANVIIDDNILIFAALMLLWVVAQVVLWPRLGSVAGTVRAPDEARTTPSNASEVRRRLLAINDLNGPIRVEMTDRDGELLVEWRYKSERWVSVMSAGALSSLRRVRLRLDERSHRALARDEQSAVSWELVGGSAAVAGELKWKVSRGIVFLQYERAAQYGIVLKDGVPSFDVHYEYCFDIRELRAPIFEVLRKAGWNYRPVIAFNRLFGG